MAEVYCLDGGGYSMAEVLRNWILGLAGAGILTVIVSAVTPEGRVKRVVSLVCGLAVIIMLIKPAVGFDYGSYSRSLARLRWEAEEFSLSLRETNEKLSGLIIEEACTAYILDKGAELGITDLKASVSATWSEEGSWYPASAKLTTQAEEGQRAKLTFYIESELGIPPEELIWSMDHEG